MDRNLYFFRKNRVDYLAVPNNLLHTHTAHLAAARPFSKLYPTRARRVEPIQTKGSAKMLLSAFLCPFRSSAEGEIRPKLFIKT